MLMFTGDFICNSVNTKELIEENIIIIFPNPSTTQIHIHNNINSIKNIDLYDVTGKLIDNVSVNNKKTFVFDVSSYKSGSYP